MNPITPIEVIRRRLASADFSSASSDLPLEPCEQSTPDSDPPLPERIAALIAARARAQSATFRPMPAAGQIVRVPPCPDQSGLVYSDYLAVLLDKEIALGKWRGWLVSRDADYASEWDLVLGPEEEPCDPLCQIVQIWNPLVLSVQQADRVLAELSAERLAAARSLERDFTQKLVPSPIDDHRIGVHLARELSDGTGVVTGTPINPQGDPRMEYQQLLRDLALSIDQLEMPAMAAPHLQNETLAAGTVWDRIKASFSMGNSWLRPAAAFALLLVVPVLVIQMWRDAPDQAPVIQGSYISDTGSQQELDAADPAAKARDIENQLRTLGVQPEIRFESSGNVVIIADLTGLSETVRKQWLATQGLTDPVDKHLRLLIVPTTNPTTRSTQ